MAKKSTTTANTKGETGGLVFLGCLLAGAGAGYMAEQIVAGAAIGLGVGFVALALLTRK